MVLRPSYAFDPLHPTNCDPALLPPALLRRHDAHFGAGV
jgi:hypothetical protein